MNLENNTLYMLVTGNTDMVKNIKELWAYDYNTGFTRLSTHYKYLSNKPIHDPEFCDWNWNMYDFNIITRDEAFVEML